MSRIFTLAAFFIAINCGAQTGLLNAQFSGGTITTSFTGDNCQADDIALQPNGCLVAGGYALLNGVKHFAMARYKQNGSLDASFGMGGKVLLSLSASGSWISSLDIQNDGKILAGGSIELGPTIQFALMRFLPSGAPDASFGVNGLVTLAAGSYSYIKDVAVQNDGKIIVAGESFINGSYDFVVARYTNTGTLDLSFSNGIASVDFGGNDVVKSVRLLPDGQILVGGSSNYKFALAKLDASGEPVGSFGNGGMVTTVAGTVPGNDNGLSLAVQADGKILMAGEAYNPPYASDICVIRYNTNGTLDQSFGNGGIALTDIDGSFDQASSVSVQNDGKIVVSGNTTYQGQPRVLLARFMPNGSFDPGFGVNGRTIAFLGNEGYVYSMVFHGNKIFIAGVIKNQPDQFAILSFTTDAFPLPLRFLDFVAQKEAGYVSLQWTTENEINVEGFTVEKSTDGRNFSDLHSLPASNAASTIKNYRATDMQPSTVNYYRIRSRDFDGAIAYSKIIAVKTGIDGIEIFPNPVRTAAQLQLPAGIQEEVNIDVVDASGRVLQRQRLQLQGLARSVSLDLSGYVKGIYFVNLSANGIKYTQRMLKE